MPPIGGVRAGYLSAGKDAIPDSGISRFEFEDDSQFSTLVDSWASNDGTLNNGTYVTGGVEFDGSSDNYGTLPNATIPFGSGEFSVAIWLTSTGSGSVETHWGLRNSNHNIEVMHNGGVLRFSYFAGGDNVQIESSSDFRDGDEHLFVFGIDSNGAEGFVDDGTTVGTDSEAATFDFEGEDPNVGRRGGSGGSDRSSPMTALRLDTYDERLSVSQVSNLWNAGSING